MLDTTTKHILAAQTHHHLDVNESIYCMSYCVYVLFFMCRIYCHTSLSVVTITHFVVLKLTLHYNHQPKNYANETFLLRHSASFGFSMKQAAHQKHFHILIPFHLLCVFTALNTGLTFLELCTAMWSILTIPTGPKDTGSEGMAKM